MGDGDDGVARARMQKVQRMEQRPKPLSVLPHGGLVQQQQLRLRGCHGCNGHPALLALGKGVGMSFRQMCNAEQLHDLPRKVLAFGGKGHLLGNRRHKELAVGVLIHHAHPPKPRPAAAPLPKGRVDELPYLSHRGTRQPGNQPQQGGLSAAVVAKEQKPLTLEQCQIDAL